MNKQEFVAALQAKLADFSKKQVEDFLNAFTDTLIATVAAGDSILLAGFGAFDHAESKARDGRNPRTGEVIKIAAAKKPRFKAAKAFKDAVNK